MSRPARTDRHASLELQDTVPTQPADLHRTPRIPRRRRVDSGGLTGLLVMAAAAGTVAYGLVRLVLGVLS